ncbi:hypothetical protein CB0940_08592 [Cercospora beticola]|uniref:Uncharacterized protein n=1 Tax=Cercospora beticola TaxID=122368 RepID=A0A2G5HQA9_CERBT|nr:hypothetical protein CB0940_08592 [Cercospora beticola]PIA94731.1 hypothetical protein CB0940_08592 [Cercospora beticola]WPB05169.1 hypothetical protein RHO25_009819 [Cercospora beticola]
MSANTDTKSAHLAPPEQDIKDDSSDWESPDENEKDKAPDKRSVQKGPDPLYHRNEKVGLLEDRGPGKKWKVTQVHYSNNTYDLLHDDGKTVKLRVPEGKIE